MPPSETYSTTAVDGSSNDSQDPRPTAADKALASQRITTFMADTSLAPPLAWSYSGYYDIRNTVASRCQAAAMNINMFHEAFNKDDRKENEHQVQNQKRK
ncbi:hypothetical protein IFR05_003783 [Cadophora sp. M221]|nr:hypothetical protein IFR05_003783 [Cadophora sp. M221]